ncbi:MAG TPA: hypothetical protein PL131_01520 [Methylotenera sp.]|nr:hypothetical protein [Methylotenera sp.]HPH04524.1 hypothetical protein [Methylotenera sp.]
MKKINYFCVLIMCFMHVGCYQSEHDRGDAYKYRKIASDIFMSGDAQLWGRAWKKEVLLDDHSLATVNCDDVDRADKASKCIVELNPVQRNNLYPPVDKEKYKVAVGDVGGDIKGVHLVVKMKAWAQSEGAYCQIAIKMSPKINLLNSSDYVSHIETYGDSNWKLSGRKISYISIPIIFVSHKKFYMEIQKEIIKDCELSVALNTIGYYL